MLENTEVAESFIDKSVANLIISSVFKPSPFETYNCILKLKKNLLNSIWVMKDICIFEQGENEYVSIFSMYSDELLEDIKQMALVSITVPQGA